MLNNHHFLKAEIKYRQQIIQNDVKESTFKLEKTNRSIYNKLKETFSKQQTPSCKQVCCSA